MREREPIGVEAFMVEGHRERERERGEAKGAHTALDELPPLAAGAPVQLFPVRDMRPRPLARSGSSSRFGAFGEHAAALRARILACAGVFAAPEAWHTSRSTLYRRNTTR